METILRHLIFYRLKIRRKQRSILTCSLGTNSKRGGQINPFRLLTFFESGQSYTKTSVEFNYKLSYRGKKRGLDVRFFAGTMLRTNPDVPFYSLSSGARGGRDQYLFQGSYPDRFSVFPTSFWSRQMTITEGGLVSPVIGNLGYSRWLASLSITSNLPGKAGRIPIKPFANILFNDHGTGAGQNSQLFCEAGLKAGLWNFFEIYVPLIVSGNIESITGSVKDRIRLVFNLDSFNQVNLNSGIGIQIR